MANRVDPLGLIRELSELPHRGATTAEARQAADRLEMRLRGLGAEVRREPFTTPKTYLSILGWTLGATIVGLVVQPLAPWVAVALAAAGAIACLLFFDWRWTPATLLPPRGTAENLFAHLPNASPGDASRKQLILMAHYDTAPAAVAYRPSMVKGFRTSLLVSLGVLAAAPAVLLVSAFVQHPALGWLRWAIAAYLAVQLVVAGWDFVRLGYVNGANDNAAGVAAAVATAANLWDEALPGWDVSLLLTSAEEVGCLGAFAWFDRHAREYDPARTFVLNLDGGGVGTTRYITRSGLLTPNVYDNELSRAAQATSAAELRFAHVRSARWSTGDFDAVVPHRRGFCCLTLTSMDSYGVMANLHRPSDRFENIDQAVPRTMADFATATAVRLARSAAAKPSAA